VVSHRGDEARSEYRQPGGQGRRDQARIGHHGGARTIRYHRIRRIESRQTRKSFRPQVATPVGRRSIVPGMSDLIMQALAQTTDPDMLARDRRAALNFANAVAERRQAMALRAGDESQ
jgi:hypothetical protein